MSKTDVSIRLLSAGEASVLERVDEDVFDNPVRADYVEAFLRDPRSLIAVAVHDGIVIGMATAFVYGHPDKPLQLFINEVGVSERYQRRGLGTQLMQQLLDHGRTRGCAEAWVATEEENVGARAFYSAIDGREDPSRAVVFTYPLAGDAEEER